MAALLQPLRRLPLARHAARMARRAWEDLRPLPRPRYLEPTPDTGSEHVLDPFFPPTISTLADAAVSPEAEEFVIGVLHKLTPEERTEGQELFYRWGQGKFGARWRFADSTTVLCAAAILLRAKSYLEIGVRRGRSAAVVGAASPECAIYGFDLWIADYAGAANPGPDFVRAELCAAGHRGPVTLVSGDSRHTLPAFLAQHAELFFDLISIDGDHSVGAASADMANALPRLKVGGIIVFDDICSAPALLRVWNWFVKEDDRYRSWEFTDAGAGVAAAVRVA